MFNYFLLSLFEVVGNYGFLITLIFWRSAIYKPHLIFSAFASGAVKPILTDIFITSRTLFCYVQTVRFVPEKINIPKISNPLKGSHSALLGHF